MSYITGPDPQIRLNYINVIQYFVLPILVVIFSWIVWSIYALFKKLSTIDKRDKIIATISILWFLFYPTIVTKLASSVNC